MRKIMITLVTLVMVAGFVCGYFAYEEKEEVTYREEILKEKVLERKEMILSLYYGGEELIYYFDRGYSVNIRFITGVEDIIAGRCYVYENVSAGDICRLISEHGDSLRITSIEPSAYSETNLIRYW